MGVSNTSLIASWRWTTRNTQGPYVGFSPLRNDPFVFQRVLRTEDRTEGEGCLVSWLNYY